MSEPSSTFDHMMLPPDDLEREPYHVPRGICPTCGSGDITHLVIGLPTGPDVMTGDPTWVRWIGCVHPGYDRECTSCGSTWTAQAALRTHQSYDDARLPHRWHAPSSAVADRRPDGMKMRLLAGAGAAFALIPHRQRHLHTMLDAWAATYDGPEHG